MSESLGSVRELSHEVELEASVHAVVHLQLEGE